MSDDLLSMIIADEIPADRVREIVGLMDEYELEDLLDDFHARKAPFHSDYIDTTQRFPNGERPAIDNERYARLTRLWFELDDILEEKIQARMNGNNF